MMHIKSLPLKLSVSRSAENLTKSLHTMKKSFTILIPSFISFLALLFTGCGATPSSVSEDMISEIKEMTEILNGIKSQEDFDSAKSDLEGHSKKCEELAKQMKAMEKELSKEEMKEVQDKYEEDLKNAFMGFMAASMKAAAYGFEMPNMK